MGQLAAEREKKRTEADTRVGALDLGRHPLERGQLRPRDEGEVVVLVVVPDIESKAVEPPIVRVCLLIPEEHVMLCDEVRRDRVDGTCKKGRQQEVP